MPTIEHRNREAHEQPTLPPGTSRGVQLSLPAVVLAVAVTIAAYISLWSVAPDLSRWALVLSGASIAAIVLVAVAQVTYRTDIDRGMRRASIAPLALQIQDEARFASERAARFARGVTSGFRYNSGDIESPTTRAQSNLYDYVVGHETERVLESNGRV
jgi:hypothetical protein